MFEISAEEFVQRLNENGLLEPADAWSCFDQLAAAGAKCDSPTLANELVARGTITDYQAKNLLRVRPEPLRLDDYLILNRIGHGNMGTVCRARNLVSEQIVAIKILAAAASASPTMLRRFHREAKTARQMDHLNIVSAFDSNEVDGVHYMALEYVEGEDLHDHIRSHGPLSPKKSVDYLLQAARGLQHAHEKGVVHRDVKPANLLLRTSDSVVKVVDLGLAAIKECTTTTMTLNVNKLTMEGATLGTADYMSPEQASDTGSVDHRSDIYALGCTWFFFLSGRSPFRGETLAETLMLHYQAPIPSLSETGATLTPEHDRIFQKMLAKDAGERHDSLLEVIAELEACPEIAVDESSFEETTIPPQRGPGAVDASPSNPIPNIITTNTIRGSVGGKQQITARKSAATSATPSADSGSKIMLPRPAPLSSHSDHGSSHTSTHTGENSQTVDAKKESNATQDNLCEPAWKKYDPLSFDSGMHRETATRIVERGGQIGVRCVVNSRLASRKAVLFLTDLPNDPFYIESVTFAPAGAFRDDDLRGLQGLNRLVHLSLCGSGFTNDGLYVMADLPSIERLELSSDAITDDGLYFITRLPKLSYLDLREVQLTDFAVDYLSALASIEQIVMSRDSLSAVGEDRLREELPQAQLRFV